MSPAQWAQSHPPAADFGQFLVGHWLDSLGHSIIVAPGERLERAERVENAEVPEVGMDHGTNMGLFIREMGLCPRWDGSWDQHGAIYQGDGIVP